MSRQKKLGRILGLIALLNNPVLFLPIPTHISYAQREGSTVVRVGFLIDGSSGEPLKDAVIVIRGKRIEAVGRNGEIKLPQGAKVLDMRKKVAIPGLVDAHAHYREWHAELYINHGVTTAFDIGGGVNAWSLAQRDAINNGKILGPRLFFGPRMNAPASDSEAGQGGVSNSEQARQEVRRLIVSGADMIKALENLSTEQLKVIVEEAHRAGKDVVTHSINGAEAVFAEVDIDSIEHSHSLAVATLATEEARKKLHERRTRGRDRLTTPEVHSFMEEDQYDRVIQSMISRKVFWTPTLATTWRAFSPQREEFITDEMKLFSLEGLRFVPPYFRQNTKEYFEGTGKLDPKLLEMIQVGQRKLRNFMVRFVKAGGKIQVGSDPNSILPALAMHREMELLVEAGLSPMETLLAATRNPAQGMGREKDFGIIAPGKFADLVILDGNPLENISATRRIHLVFKEGKAIKPVYHANYRNPIAQPFPDRPAPQIESISPVSVTQGEGPVKITIKGKNFMSAAVVKVNGKEIPAEVKFSPTRFPQNARASGEISATVNPKLMAKPGTYPVVVEHQGMGVSVSNAAHLMVNFK